MCLPDTGFVAFGQKFHGLRGGNGDDRSESHPMNTSIGVAFHDFIVIHFPAAAIIGEITVEHGVKLQADIDRAIHVGCRFVNQIKRIAIAGDFLF